MHKIYFFQSCCKGEAIISRKWHKYSNFTIKKRYNLVARFVSHAGGTISANDNCGSQPSTVPALLFLHVLTPILSTSISKLLMLYSLWNQTQFDPNYEIGHGRVTCYRALLICYRLQRKIRLPALIEDCMNNELPTLHLASLFVTVCHGKGLWPWSFDWRGGLISYRETLPLYLFPIFCVPIYKNKKLGCSNARKLDFDSNINASNNSLRKSNIRNFAQSRNRGSQWWVVLVRAWSIQKRMNLNGYFA